MAVRLTVIGGGPGGYTAAFAAAKAGFEVTLVESAHLGGTCLNYGCIPTKTLRASADALEMAHRLASFGIESAATATVNAAAVLARKENVIQLLRQGLEKTCAALSVRLLRGRGRVLHAGLVEVTLPEGTKEQVQGDRVLLATGSRILAIPSLPVDQKYVLDSDAMLALDHVPARLIIVGGGVIGCEMAFIYQAFGAQVTVVEGMNRVLGIPAVDASISSLIQREMKKRRIQCELGRTLTDIQVVDGVVQAKLAPSPFIAQPTPAQQKIVPVQADMVLVSIGRAANTEGLGLAEAGVATDARGWVCVNENMQTSVPHIYAVGDVLGPQHTMLAHVAAMEALCALENMQGRAKAMDYSVVPSGIFTAPEVGCVGLSEAQAQEQGYAVRTATVQMRELGKAHAMNELAGMIKLVAEEGTGRLLGAHIAGAHATDLIAEMALALSMKATAQDVCNTIHAHPTLAEGIYEAALQL
jgi:dihydrolipoamide dehydrogenase